MTLSERVRAAGVVGAGGAGFPTEVKVRARADTVIVNGAECEPLLITDQRVMLRSAEDVLAGLRLVADAVGARRRVLAVKKPYAAVIARATPLLKDGPEVELFLLDDFYPAGDEHVTVHDVTGRVVPEGGIPPDVGVVVQNVVTLMNVRRAVDGIPVTSRPLTVAGEVARPGAYEVPIGMSVAEVLAAAGGATRPDVAVVDGGPMMGYLLPDLDHVVTKTTSGLLVLPEDSPVVRVRRASLASDMRRAATVCCQCRLCTDLCPRWLLGHRLQPHLAMRAALAARPVPPDVEGMGYLCSQCGVCEAYACPLGLSPRRVLGEFRGRQARAKVPNPYRARPDHAREAQAWIRPPKPRLALRLGLEPYHLHAAGAIEPVADPWEVRIPLRQHVGAAAVPVVRRGDAVRRGDLLADIPPGALGARIHASIDGTVTWIDDQSVRIARGPA